MTGSTLPFLDAGSIAELVPIADAISSLRAAFARDPAHVERVAVPAAGGDFTRLRTPAVSMIPALRLARASARSAIVIGQGRRAWPTPMRCAWPSLS